MSDLQGHDKVWFEDLIDMEKKTKERLNIILKKDWENKHKSKDSQIYDLFQFLKDIQINKQNLTK